MKSKFLTLAALLLITLISSAQSELSIPRYVQLPKDSIVSDQLISDLNKFLIAAQEENELNSYILPTEKVETYILLDEFKGIEKARKDENFFKPYLNTVVKLEPDTYLIQLSHIGVNDSIPYLRTVYNLIAHHQNNTFLFSSPLLENTKQWKTLAIENCTFHYKDTLNYDNALAYVKLSKLFDAKLNSEDKKTKLYCTNSRMELLDVIGIDYRLDYNGQTTGTFSAVNGDEQLIVLGNGNEEFDIMDPHDLWHDRLKLVISRRKVNKPVDEGCAYIYGGSWGMSWETIFSRFMTEIAFDKDTDWTDYKENKKNFGESQEEHLMVDYVINALLIQKIEKEIGFSGVWDLLNCGVYETGNENYYTALHNIIGISKVNYNKEVWKLIKAELKRSKSSTK